MRIEQSFDLPYPRALVWDAMSNVTLVAECLPGAKLLEEIGPDRHKGSFAVKVGPLAASFLGEVEIARDPAAFTATVSGKGADARSSSRASGSMTYALAEAPGGTTVNVVCEVNLAGALAQFGKAGIIQEIANRITAEFVKNFRARLEALAPAPATGAASEAPAAPRPAPAEVPQALDAGNLFWTILRERIAGVFRRLFGRAG